MKSKMKPFLECFILTRILLLTLYKMSLVYNLLFFSLRKKSSV